MHRVGPVEQLVERQADALCRKEYEIQQRVPWTKELRRVVEAMNALSRKVREAIAADTARAAELQPARTKHDRPFHGSGRGGGTVWDANYATYGTVTRLNGLWHFWYSGGVAGANEGIGYLLISAGSAMQMGLAFAGLVVVGAMAMIMYELFSVVEKHTTAWAHRGSQNG